MNGLAPATFGSPLAHKGRSWLGSVFKGDKNPFSPDFLEAGNRVLHGLELASPFTWDLAGRDLLGENPVFTTHDNTPWAFIFCGTERYGGIKRLASEHGTDGTVRLAGCALDSRKIRVDLTLERGRRERFVVDPWRNYDAPLIPVKGRNHGSIVTEPSPELVRMVRRALTVKTAADYKAWLADDDVVQACRLRDTLEQWQQFVVRAVDERGDGIEDWNLQLTTRIGGEDVPLDDFDLDVHAYAGDPSYRSFHVDINRIKGAGLQNLWMRVIASSGSSIVGYRGEGSEKMVMEGDKMRMVEDGKWDAAVNLTPTLHPAAAGEAGATGPVDVFYPFTTTLIELKLNREPLPPVGRNKVLWWKGERAT